MTPDWQEYYKNTKDMPPSPTLVQALASAAKRDEALDLGSGALKDSRYLLAEGFGRVTAVDMEAPPPEILEMLPKDRFAFVQNAFEDYEFPEKRFDLVNAQYSLPFTPPAAFDAVWARLGDSLVAGGIFVGQLFGDRDGWNLPGKKMTFHMEAQARELLSGYEILSFQERDFDGKLASGQPKHWHVFHVIARKK